MHPHNEVARTVLSIVRKLHKNVSFPFDVLDLFRTLYFLFFNNFNCIVLLVGKVLDQFHLAEEPMS